MLHLRSGEDGRSAPSRSRDLLARPQSALFWWGLPLLAGLSTNFLSLTPATVTAVWAMAMVWMGLGCALNARRCHRLHCYISAPVLFLGAVGAAAIGFGLTPWGPGAAGLAINVSLALALMTLLAEPVWGRYRAR